MKLSGRYIALQRVKPHPSPPLRRGGSQYLPLRTGESQGESPFFPCPPLATLRERPSVLLRERRGWRV